MSGQHLAYYNIDEYIKKICLESYELNEEEITNNEIDRFIPFSVNCDVRLPILDIYPNDLKYIETIINFNFKEFKENHELKKIIHNNKNDIKFIQKIINDIFCIDVSEIMRAYKQRLNNYPRDGNGYFMVFKLNDVKYLSITRDDMINMLPSKLEIIAIILTNCTFKLRFEKCYYRC